MTQSLNQDFRLLPLVINGGIAGIIGVTCVFPIDFVKTRMQNQKNMAGQEPLYKNMFDCLMKSVRSKTGGGFHKLYSGLAVNIALITPEKAIKLVANDCFCHLLKTEHGALPVHRQILAGAGAGTCQIIVTTPMELLKIQMQMSKKNAVHSTLNARHLAMKLLREKGIFGLYQGIGATYIRDVYFSMIFFPLFTYFNNKGKSKNVEMRNEQVPFYHSFVSGIGAGAIGAFCATPIDVIKTRLQTLEYNNRYSGMVDCARKILQQEGIRAFFKGSFLCVMYVASLFGVAQMVYQFDISQRYIQALMHHQNSTVIRAIVD